MRKAEWAPPRTHCGLLFALWCPHGLDFHLIVRKHKHWQKLRRLFGDPTVLNRTGA